MPVSVAQRILMPALVTSCVTACGASPPSSTSESSTCTTAVIDPIIVSVTDATSGLNICDADVVVTDPSTTIHLTSNAPDLGVTYTPCSYSNNTGTRYTDGPYTVSVRAPEYQAAQIYNVNVRVDHCGSADLQQSLVVNLLKPQKPPIIK